VTPMLGGGIKTNIWSNKDHEDGVDGRGTVKTIPGHAKPPPTTRKGTCAVEKDADGS